MTGESVRVHTGCLPLLSVTLEEFRRVAVTVPANSIEVHRDICSARAAIYMVAFPDLRLSTYIILYVWIFMFIFGSVQGVC